MTNTTANEPFEHLPMARKDIPQAEDVHYRVYKDINDFVVIKAQTALEALQTSGVTAAYKIERDNIDFNKVLDAQSWPKEPAAVLTETPPAADAAPPASPPASDAPAAAGEEAK